MSEEELPKEKWWKTVDLYKWEGFWFLHSHLKAAIAAQSSFTARDGDIILASPMKTGCTWLKALIPCIMDEKSRTLNGDDHEDMLTKNHPNDLMPSLELQIFNPSSRSNFLSEMRSPRLFRTHVSYGLLSESAKQSRCKIVYIARDPKDVFVSLWYFINSSRNHDQVKIKPYPIEEAFDEFCRGIHAFGPFHDHVLGYWKESQERPDKILFLKYEDIKKNPVGEVTKLASFLGKPFLSDDQEEAERVLWRCSLERLKNLEVNKEGLDPWSTLPKNAYFRKGVVGDWRNHLTPEMKERLDEITRDKFQGTGLDILFQ